MLCVCAFINEIEEKLRLDKPVFVCFSSLSAKYLHRKTNQLQESDIRIPQINIYDK